MINDMFLGYIDPGSGYTIFSIGGLILSLLAGFLGLFLAYFKKIFNFFKKRKTTLIILLIGATLVTGVAAIIAKGKKMQPFKKKIIILGLDGLDANIVEQMMNEGVIPNFSRLRGQGSYRRLQTSNPPQSPVAWAAFSTGKNPAENGIYDFIVRNPRDYSLKLSLSDISFGKSHKTLKSKAFWQYLTKEKIPSVILNCPLTFPPDRIYGRMLSGMGVPDILGTEGTFTFYTTEPPETKKDVGGQVFHITRTDLRTLELIGPRIAELKNLGKNAKVPFAVRLAADKKSIAIEYQKHKTILAPGSWSGWQEVTFRIGLFKRMKGIFKFYLVQIEPEFKLYITPIQFDPNDPPFPISYPADYSRQIAQKLGPYHTQGMPEDTWSINELRLTEKELLEQTEEIFKEKKSLLDYELGRFQEGVLFSYFGMTDTIQHMFWRYTDPGHPLYEKDASKEYKEMIRTWYKKMDAVVGEVLKKIGKDDTLIILSDHGFNTFRRAVHLNTWLKENGYLFLKDPQASEGEALLADIDWSKTKVYAIGFGALYINQQGREAQGIVEPGEEATKIKKELIHKLSSWLDEKYKQPVVYYIYKKEDIFKGRLADEAPDLYVGFNIGYRASWQTALGAVPKDLIEDNLKKWSGDHLFDPNLVPGVIFTNKIITKESPTIYDMAPTILKMAGLEDRKTKKYGFQGQALF
jgi:predicted AlkP superfamily phosphohydrolase/phosphomutase